jgi:hypothetical protein
MDGQTREGEATSASAPSTETTAKMKPNTGARRIRSNETELSHRWRKRALLLNSTLKSCESYSSERPAVGCSDWLDVCHHRGVRLCPIFGPRLQRVIDGPQHRKAQRTTAIISPVRLVL